MTSHAAPNHWLALGEVYVPMSDGGSEVLVEELNPAASIFVGDVQVGHPAAEK